MFYYKTDAGTFWIKQESNGRWTLRLNGEALGSYNSPEQAADDVYMQATGSYEWDSKDEILEPTDLGEWNYS